MLIIIRRCAYDQEIFESNSPWIKLKKDELFTIELFIGLLRISVNTYCFTKNECDMLCIDPDRALQKRFACCGNHVHIF